jgi:tRNA A-37 threonylcarbamoyl transferase component Bud32
MEGDPEKRSVVRLGAPKGAGSAVVAAGAANGVRPAGEAFCAACKRAFATPDAAPLETRPCPGCGRSCLVPGRLGDFLLHARLGEGAMGSIYQATDEHLHREAAIKVVRTRSTDDAEQRERLQAEARAAAQLNHPRLAQVYSFGFAAGRPYLVMELVRGENLESRLHGAKRLDERDTLAMALDVADGLRALHRQGLTHGDIKPANIVSDRDGHIKLVDFGLAGMDRRDGSGAIMGTPFYLAPELLRGEPDTPRSDLYMLGATLYHLLAGTPPFEAATPEQVARLRLERPAEPIGSRVRHLSWRTERLVMRLLEADPERRYPDADAVAAELRAALDSLTLPAGSRTAAAPAAPPAAPVRGAGRRYRWFPLAASATALALATVVLVRTGAFRQTWARLVRPPTASPPAAGPAPALTRPLTPVWRDAEWDCPRHLGSTVWTGDELLIQVGGAEPRTRREAGRCVETAVGPDFRVTAQVNLLSRSDPGTRCGILIGSTDPAAGSRIYFGLQEGGRLFLEERKAGRAPVLIKVDDQPASVPCRMRLERRPDRCAAMVMDAAGAWQLFAVSSLKLPADSRLALGVTTTRINGVATASFGALSLAGPAAP